MAAIQWILKLPECLINTFPSNPAVKGTAPQTLLNEVLAAILSKSRAELIRKGVFSRSSPCCEIKIVYQLTLLKQQMSMLQCKESDL